MNANGVPYDMTDFSPALVEDPVLAEVNYS